MNGNRRVVISGLGAVTPCGNDIPRFWNKLIAGESAIKQITKCDTRGLKIKVGGQVLNLDPIRMFKKRFLRKCDDFSVYALTACDEALKDARLSNNDFDAARFGICIGNNCGGWKSAENGLNDIRSGDSVSPFLASNWFPAATQGYISINFKLTGFSKTVIADISSSSIAIINAYKAIKSGKADFMLAGGTESSMVRWALVFYQTCGAVNFGTRVPETLFQPFGIDKDGLVIGEGAGFVVLETLESAKKRGAEIYAEICGCSVTADGRDNVQNSIEQYSRSIETSLRGELPDYISLNGIATDSEDMIEINGIKKALKNAKKKPLLSCPKTYFGNTFGAAGALDVIISCMTMKKGIVIKTGNYPIQDCGLNIVSGNNVATPVNSSLIITRSLNGINSGIFLKKVR